MHQKVATCILYLTQREMKALQQEFTKGYTLVFRILTTAVATLLGINLFLVADLKEDT